MLSKPLICLKGEIKTPPFSEEARIEVGMLLRSLQNGYTLSMPESRPMPIIGPHCHELRIEDRSESKIWRIIYRLDNDAVIIADIFIKKTNSTPESIKENCKRRLRQYNVARRKE